ncbi:hypothetical protein AVEN_129715-1 [Araneus ventricosus]|uniref:Uncharacterized protein n=1 Tax=Araneus ventricosus TaxID=182803 RepID=A0A4Y2DI71_ARAVE|nr:hypothetical protein AVEN_129715-1 [Araneus ventricosus]
MMDSFVLQRALRTRVLMRFRPPTRWRFVRDLLLLVVLFTCLTCYLSYVGSFLQNTVPTVAITLPADFTIFAFFGAGSPLKTHCFDCSFVCGV